MARIFNEQFEATGYDETWSLGETVDAGCTLDEDAKTNIINSPTAWGKRCLKADVVGATGDDACVSGDLVNVSDAPLTYLRFEFIVTAHDLDINAEKGSLIYVTDSADTMLYRTWLRYQDRVLLRTEVKLDGVAITTQDSAITIANNTRYRVEYKWDIANAKFEWRINGITEYASNLAAGRGAGIDYITFFGLNSVSAGENITAYFDNLAIDDSDWVGAESGVTGINRRGCNRRFCGLNRYNP